MTWEFSMKGKDKVRMDDYVEKMIQTFPYTFKSTDTTVTPAGYNLFENINSKPSGKSQAKYFHTMVAKALFLSKISIHDI